MKLKVGDRIRITPTMGRNGEPEDYGDYWQVAAPVWAEWTGWHWLGCLSLSGEETWGEETRRWQWTPKELQHLLCDCGGPSMRPMTDVDCILEQLFASGAMPWVPTVE